MNIEFTKMHALGNDYILINGWKHGDLLSQASELAVKMSDRHFGIGGDGIIFVLPSDNADAMMRIFNSDGSEAEMCGNGIRQVAKFLYDRRIVAKKNIAVDTLAGVKTIEVEATGNVLTRARVDMGEPILEPARIPAVAEINHDGFASVILNGFDFTLVSMGNPHAVTFIDNVAAFDVKMVGQLIEHKLEVFPSRTNVEFIELLSQDEIKMRVWERGSGETLACGTGASASVVAAILNRHTGRKVLVHLLGGDLEIEWADNNRVYMTGDATVVCDGVYYL